MNKRIEEEIDVLQAEIKAKQKEISDLRSQLELEEVKDYSLLDAEGNSVLLSSLFDERNELLVTHNMGKQCSYCTLWADGFNGFAKPLTDRVPFVVVSPDLPEVQQAFAASRGWTFPMLSSNTSSFLLIWVLSLSPAFIIPEFQLLFEKTTRYIVPPTTILEPGMCIAAFGICLICCPINMVVGILRLNTSNT